MKKFQSFIALIGLFTGLMLSPFAEATESYVKQWNSAVITGSLAYDSNFKYYLEPQLRFIGDRYIFNQAFLLGGLGYQVNPDLILFAGPGWIVSKSPQGVTSHEIRFWQQASWRAIRSTRFTLDSRTRLEERKNTQYDSIAYRFRQRLWLHIPFKNYPKYSFSCFDEVFFNLNHPSWVSPYFFEQNRAFIGIGNQLTKSVSMDVGYLNQYIHSRQNQLDHVLFLSFNVNL